MAEGFLNYFELELALIQRAYRKFLRNYRRDSGKAPAQVVQKEYRDPHTERLLDGVAFLTAKTEQALAEQFPEITRSLLQLNYPGLQDILPTSTVLGLTPDKESLTTLRSIHKGVRLSPQTADDSAVTFTVAADTMLYPFHISGIKAQTAPFDFVEGELDSRANAVVRVEFSMNDPGKMFSKLAIEEVDLFLEGDHISAGRFSEALFSQLVNIQVSDGAGTSLGLLDSDKLKTRAFDEDFCFLPSDRNSYLGIQLIREFFLYPAKQAFVRLTGIGSAMRNCHSSHLTLDFFLGNLSAREVRAVSSNSFQLNCIPVINLFSTRSEPIQYDHVSVRVPVFAEAVSTGTKKISRITKLYEVTPQGEVEVPQLYNFSHEIGVPTMSWEPLRRLNEDGVQGHQVALAWGSPELNSFPKLFSAEILCTNGNLALVYDDLKGWSSIDSVEIPGTLAMLTTLTTEIVPDRYEDSDWRLLGLLNFNLNNVINSDRPELQLRQFLTLAAPVGLTTSAVASILKIDVRQSVRPMMVANRRVIAQGTRFSVYLDPQQNRNQWSLLARLIHSAFVEMCSFDRFVETEIWIDGVDEKVTSFGPDHGSQVCT
ncbi:MAG: type VI secretion system baseplate subunit TssF [Arenicellales bacterium]